MARTRVLLYTAIILLHGTANAANLVDSPILTGGYFITIDGDIKEGDFENIMNIIRKRESFPKSIHTYSNGGDVVEAMKIGRFVRKALIVTTPGVTCNSACSLIVFAGIQQTKEGRLGLHRPYYNKKYFAGLSLDQAKEKYKMLDALVSSYLREMSVPTVLGEKMMSVPSTAVEYISMEEYVRLTGVSPPAIQEWLIAQCGALTEQQKADGELLYAKFMYKSLTRMGSEDADIYKEKAIFAERLPEGYVELLAQHGKKINDCNSSVILKEQNKIYNEITKMQ